MEGNPDIRLAPQVSAAVTVMKKKSNDPTKAAARSSILVTGSLIPVRYPT